jgi:predicted  nucleic acid-binding Zn-ribbon protein
MLSHEKMQSRIDDIKNKLYPSEIDDAVLFLFTEVTKLKHENDNLKQEIKELHWRLEEHD